eukprot:g14305.t1
MGLVNKSHVFVVDGQLSALRKASRRRRASADQNLTKQHGNKRIAKTRPCSSAIVGGGLGIGEIPAPPPVGMGLGDGVVGTAVSARDRSVGSGPTAAAPSHPTANPSLPQSPSSPPCSTNVSSLMARWGADQLWGYSIVGLNSDTDNITRLHAKQSPATPSRPPTIDLAGTDATAPSSAASKKTKRKPSTPPTSNKKNTQESKALKGAAAAFGHFITRRRPL